MLPFANLSEEKSNAYFAEGIQDEILTRLAKIADLKVISRTSTQRYKSSPDDLPEIARQLGVAHIVEGSVQKSGDTVRVNVQLIKAANDFHLWANTFDRKLTDICPSSTERMEATHVISFFAQHLLGNLGRPRVSSTHACTRTHKPSQFQQAIGPENRIPPQDQTFSSKLS